MFELKKSGRGGALGYASLIQTLFNKSGINLSGIKFVSISPDQEFTQKTLSMMGYFWSDERKSYRFVRRGYIPTTVEESDESDESEEEDQEENEEEGAGQAFEQHDSPP